jgi:radical SAM superfamily enzyme YgiQ (UPF0313 family)
MIYNRVLLLNPAYPGSRVRTVFSAGLGYIAEFLKKSNIEYDVLDMSLGYGFRNLLRKIDTFQPQLIGLTMMSYQYKNTYKMISRIKKEKPYLDILVGGPHVSLFREKVLQDCPDISFGAVLEGEETIIQLCKGFNLFEIKGLIFKNDNGIVYNGDRPFIKNLDEVPFPKYTKFELEKSVNKEVSALPIVSSRGCPFECIYCPVKCSIGEVFRARSPENIVEELTYWCKKGYRQFSFADDNFTLIRERIYGLCELIKKINLKGLKLSCDNGIRADKVDRDLLRFMKDVGFYRIAFGVEGGNDKILKSLKKKEDIETIKKRIKEACDLGYEVDLFFLVGSPAETRSDLEDSFKIALDYPITTAFFYNIIPFPYTELFDWIKINGRFLKKPEEYLNNFPILDNEPVFETLQMSEVQRRKALSKAFRIMRRTTRQAWKKRLVRLGTLGRLLAIIYTTRFVQDVILRNKFFNTLIYKLAYFLVSF